MASHKKSSYLFYMRMRAFALKQELKKLITTASYGTDHTDHFLVYNFQLHIPSINTHGLCEG